MSDTPRTDELVSRIGHGLTKAGCIPKTFAKQLERELAAMTKVADAHIAATAGWMRRMLDKVEKGGVKCPYCNNFMRALEALKEEHKETVCLDEMHGGVHIKAGCDTCKLIAELEEVK